MTTRFEGDTAPVKSEAIEPVGYDSKRRVMVIRFKSGASYPHTDVSPDRHAGLMGAHCIGSQYAKHIRDRFNSTKL
jgi:KTSC domain